MLKNLCSIYYVVSSAAYVCIVLQCN